MRALFDETTLLCSKIVTQKYSTSFSLGIRTLISEYRPAIYAIYGFVRYADEIVDTFHDHDKEYLLKRFKEDTYDAISRGLSLNPILHAFQMVVNKYSIDTDLIDAFLYSMELDLIKKAYEADQYQEYIYGSAEVVGLMCLKVFCYQKEGLYQQLRQPAKRLGAAFQKVNFLRDVKSDFQERGRVYFPGVDFERFDNEHKVTIEADIKADFDAGYQGILLLPKGAQLGVYLAYIYYLKLFEKIKNLPARKIMQERIRVADDEKMYLLFKSYCRYKLNYL